MKRIVCAASIALGLTGCEASPSDQDRAAEASASQNVATAPGAGSPASPPELATAELRRVCRAAVADLNGHSPSIMKIVEGSSGTVRIRYVRPSDGKLWTNDCRVDGDRILWRTVNAFGAGSGEGRWRDDSADEVLTYAIDGDQITITTTFPGEEPASKAYTVTD